MEMETGTVTGTEGRQGSQDDFRVVLLLLHAMLVLQQWGNFRYSRKK